MSLINKSGDMTPFDMTERPIKTPAALALIVWAGCALMTPRLKLRRVGMKGVQPPYIVIATHQGFSDYYIAPRALFPHRAVYVSDMEGYAAFGKRLYALIGCTPKRRYVHDISVVRNIRHALFKLKAPVVIFPESRHCDAGVTSKITDDLGKLAKHFGVPVAVLTAHGSYLANPFWDEEHTRKTPLDATLELLFTAEDIERLSAEEINNALLEKLQYDEYAWQRENGIRISCKNRAQGLHKPLYRCVGCGAEGKMSSGGARLSCGSCGAFWDMNELGELIGSDGETVRVTDWYNGERAIVNGLIDSGEYKGLTVPVTVEALPNEKGFIELGGGTLTHDMSGFTLILNSPDERLKDSFPLRVSSKALPSVQTEYNYRGKGKCIVLSTKNCCYYVYSSSPEFIVTKLEFAAERINENFLFSIDRK